MSAASDELSLMELVARRGFQVSLPEGFVELPRDGEFDDPDDREAFAAKIAGLVGLSPDDPNAQAAADGFAQVGLASGETGLDYAAMALYRSPDDAGRPIMVLLAGVALASDHRTPAEAVKGLLELYDQHRVEAVEEIRLHVGPAVAVVTEEEQVMTVGQDSFPILTRQLNCWVPDPDGTTMGMVSVQTNSYEDWEHVCVLALDIVGTFEWAELIEQV